jgi:hypothetical protein
MTEAAQSKPANDPTLSVILHHGRHSITLGQYEVHGLQQLIGLGPEITQAIRKIMERRAQWPKRRKE